jgi:hypothetical protein
MTKIAELLERKEALMRATSSATLLTSALALAAKTRPTPDERRALAWTRDELERRGAKQTGRVIDDAAFCALLDELDSYELALLATYPDLERSRA